MRILDASTNVGVKSVSTVFRKPTPGPEYDLLTDFVRRGLPAPDQGEYLAVFIEPRIETGCPDAVAAYWRPGEGANPSVLDRLGSFDDRVLQLVWLEPGIEISTLETRYGRQVARRARELVSMGLLSDTSSCVHVPEEGLVLSRLIAVEAKIAGPASALRQAARNTWYASESYVLMPSLPVAQALCERYSSCGVGIVTPDESIEQPSVPARAWGLPQSHVTWRFNRMALELSGMGVE